MDAHQYLEAVRKRWLAIVALTLLGLVAGFGLASLQPKLYQARSSVYVAAQGGNTTIEQLQGATFAQSIVESYVELATEPVVLKPVIAKLGLRETTVQLAKRLKADLTVNTVIIGVTATDPSPSEAAKVANAVTRSLSRAAATLSKTGKKPAIVMRSVASAEVPTQPSSPNLPFLLASGLGVGLIFGLAYAVGRQLLDTRIGSDEELRALPVLRRAPYLGSVAHRRGRKRVANVLLTEPRGIVAEDYRRLVTNLEFAGVDSHIRSVTVTSALAGDGKSTTALNLAAAAAERAQRVLLVDGDLRSPSVAEYLGIDGSVGLTDVLVGSAQAAHAVQRLGEMDVLPAGTVPPNVTQLVTSDAMARLFQELLMRYDLVIVDAPPLLPVVDALTFSKLTDGAVVVSRQRITRRKQLVQAVESLSQVGAAVLGVVLNDVKRARADGHGYGYGSAAPPSRPTGAASDMTTTFFPGDERRPAPEVPPLPRAATPIADDRPTNSRVVVRP